MVHHTPKVKNAT